MEYFIDTEFIEGFHKPLFGKKRHFIDLISIGIVCEDSREYYAISKEFNPKHADEWVKKNVISKLPQQRVSFYDSPRLRQESLLWKSNKQIAEDIMSFVNPSSGENSLNYESWNNHLNKYSVVASENRPIEFYGYYADYDWVLFCSLFGKMIDLPKGFPMYCKDLKQMIDEAAEKIPVAYDVKVGLKTLKLHKDYPEQSNEHNALDDAKWNKRLYDFVKSISPPVLKI